MFRRIIQVYLESVLNNEIVAWYISYLDRRPGNMQNYHESETEITLTKNESVKSQRRREAFVVVG